MKAKATTLRPRYGSHLSVAGGGHLALTAAVRLQLDSVQVFTKNQRQWTAPPLRDEQIALWREAVVATGWPDAPQRIVSHNSYLVNLASPDPVARARSIALQRDELERCEVLGIAWCVMHPGAHLGAPRRPSDPNVLRAQPNVDEAAGIERIAAALDQLHRELGGYKVVTCLETTTGSGTNIGYDFAHLAKIRSLVRDPERVGICVDTCHIVAAGYDLSTRSKARAVLQEFDEVCGLAAVRVVHLNDSEGAMGSRKDRHAHIGAGCCGDACFHAILNAKALWDVPMILETPKEEDESDRSDEAWDLVNIKRLEAMRLLKTLVMVVLVALLAGLPMGCQLFSGGQRPTKRAALSPSAAPVEPTANEQAKLVTATQMRNAGDNEAALALFQELLDKNPLLPEAYVGIGDVRFSQGRFVEAEPSYKRAVTLDPADFQAQYGHGRSLQMLGRLAESIGAYQRALVANPKSAEVNLNMATAYLSLGDPRVAAQFAERAVQLEPRNGAAHVNLGVSYERLGRPADAIMQYQAAAELLPQTPQLLTNMVNAYVADGRYPEAVNTAIALTKLASGPETFERLGWAEFRAGNYDSSSVAYRQSVVLDPNYWPSWNGIGVNALNRWLLSEKRDDLAASEARRAFRASMQANPNQPKVLKLYTTYGL
ncbi:MAG: deoxyribonuclease IV [Phycisphaerales bacterium]|nr:deoxyribonuclease IV [Phycisphaerales bacterium]